MASNPQVLGLLEEMLNSEKTPEEVCRDCPELLPEVRERWREFRLIDAQVVELLPGLGTTAGAGAVKPAPSADDLPHADDLPQVPGYELFGEVGRGGMGVVYRARQCALDRQVAVKMLLAGPLASPQELGRFRRETAALACLRHPNIVQVYDAGDVEGRPYFAMELVDGGSLAQKLAGTPQLARPAAALVFALAEAVELAHKSGIVHRDLKPANILLTADGTPKVSDFGLARRLDGEEGLTRTGAALGTPSYMAPEQAQGRADAVGPAIDVYALGAILYELLTGRPPFRAATAAETLQQVMDEEPVPPSRLNTNVSRDLTTICLKCLQKRPEQRYSSAGDLADDLVRFRDGLPILARPVGLVERSLKWIRRRPATTLSITAVGLLVIAGLVLSWQSQARLDRARTSLSALRGRTADLRKNEQWAAAEELLVQSQRLLKDAKAESLAGEISAELSQVRLASDLEQVRFRREVFDSRSAVKDVIDSYDRLFRSVRWNPSDKDPSLAQQIEASYIKDQVVAALDDWAFAEHETGNLAQCQQLMDLVRKIDRDPWRVQVRDFTLWTNRQHLEHLADTAKDDEPLPLIAFLAALMNRAKADAVPMLQQAYNSHPDDPDINWQLGIIMYQRGEILQAAGFFRAVLASRPKNSNAFFRLGYCLQALGKVDDAITAYNSAIEIDDHNGNFHLALGTAYGHKGKLDDELTVYRRGIDVDPTHYALRTNLGTALIRYGSLEEAIEQLRTAIDLKRDDPIAYDGLGVALLRSNKIEDAIAAFRAGIKVDDRNAGLHLNLGCRLYATNRTEEAIAELRRTIDLEPEGKSAYLALVPILVRLKKFDEALAIAKKGADHVARNDAEYRMIESDLKDCERFVRLNARLKDIAGDQENDISNSERLDLARFCQYPKHDYGTAARLYKEALALEPVLGADIGSRNLYHAAHSTILHSLDASNGLSESERSQNLQQARQWLQADLDGIVALAAKPNYDQAQITEALKQFHEDTVLERVLNSSEAWVPSIEHAAWERLRTDAVELANRIPTWCLLKGRRHAEHREWSDAARCYARAFTLQDSFLSDTWFEYAAIELLAGNKTSYEVVCQRFLERARNGELRRYHLARAFTLCPRNKETLEEVSKLAEEELDKFNDQFWSRTVQGALKFRVGEFDEACKFFELSCEADSRPGRAVLNWLWLALAGQKMRKSQQVQAELGRSRRWMAAYNDGLSGQEDQMLGTHFHNYLEAQILLREATEEMGTASPDRN